MAVCASVPKAIAKAAARCSSVHPAVFFLIVSMISGSLIVPFLNSSTATPMASKALRFCLDGFKSRDKAPRKAVPPLDA